MSPRLEDRRELMRCLKAALDALEHDDDLGFRRQIELLARREDEAMRQALARLARELGEVLGAVPTACAGVAELPDACSRLDHVVAMTEQATHRTLDLVEDSRALVDLLQRAALPPELGDIAARLRSNLSEMALAQSHQDLGGQIIRRVVGLVRGVHDALGAVGMAPAPASSMRGHGPAVAGVDAHTPDDAHALISELGL